MGDSTIEWTDTRYWVSTERRWKVYKRQRTDRPGRAERRRRSDRGFRWCRGCRTWLTSDLVLRQGVCRTHANEEYRAGYAAQGGAGIRAQKYARKRRLTIIPPDWRAERIDEFGGRCAYGCGRPATTLDHVWPVAGGGRSIPSNLVPACGPCNSRKRHGDPEPWIARGMAAYPALWAETIALANEHGEDWTEAA